MSWTFVITERENAAAAAAEMRATHALGLLDPGVTHPALPGVPDARRLMLAVRDVEGVDETAAPSRPAIEAILTWGRRLPADARLLVHCEAGQARSPAAALALLAQALGVGREDEAARLVYAARGIAAPNRLMVRLVDEALGCEGRLIAAADSRSPWQTAPSGLILLRPAPSLGVAVDASGRGAR